MSPHGHWITTPIQRNQPKLKMFCFPHAGGGTAAFRGWGDALGSQVEVSFVQLPGREARIREHPFTDFQPIVSTLASEMARSISGPYVFYGHSLGAMLAFETIRALRRNEVAPPAHLFVAASPGPRVPWPHSRIHHLNENEFIDQVGRRYGGLPKAVIDDPELRSLLLPTLRADLKVLETYQYRREQSIPCSITAFGGIKDVMVSAAHLDAWRSETAGSFRLQMLEGNHFFHFTPCGELFRSISEEIVRWSS